MVARNDITGDSIQTKGVTDAYRDNFDNIFRKNKKTDAEKFDEAIMKNEYYEEDMQVRVKENSEEFGKCGCGRSPTGKCIGWHGLTEEQFQDRLEQYQTGKQDLNGDPV